MSYSIYSPQKLRELARKLDRESSSTPCHSENVANLALDLCGAMAIRGRRKDIVVAACLIHDIGKALVDADIWAKGEKLNYTDWVKIKMHPAIAARLAKEAGYGDKVAELLYYHHVWFNGNGYPEAKKKGLRIPIGARILAVCDAYEAMVSNRSYRRSMSRPQAVEELKRHSIEQFDPRIVEIFAAVIGMPA